MIFAEIDTHRFLSYTMNSKLSVGMTNFNIIFKQKHILRLIYDLGCSEYRAMPK